ncbi:MAG: EthD domain-containing protein [Thermomicrobiales bacterium]|nr:EthD domain-containing protein [Thermomicrobiales bacterium]
MVKVTVLYNLPPGTDEEAFLRWRMGDHNAANVKTPGVLKGDFYRIVGTAMVGPNRPASAQAPWRFVTEAYYESIETFEASWNAPEEQDRLVPAFAKIADAIVLVSEELQSHIAE